MIVVDASAVLAIYLGEPERLPMRRLLEENVSKIAPVNYWEVLVRAHKVHGPQGAEDARGLIIDLGMSVASMSGPEAQVAYEAFAKFGKGVGGPLNLGDCFAYALAKHEEAPLLYKGDDFGRTDVRSALG